MALREWQRIAEKSISSEPGKLWGGSIVIEIRPAGYSWGIDFWCRALHYVPWEPPEVWALFQDSLRNGPHIANSRIPEGEAVAGRAAGCISISNPTLEGRE